MNTDPTIRKTLQDADSAKEEVKVDPAWAILSKHLDGVEAERYPRFSDRKLCVEAMLEHTKEIHKENDRLKRQLESKYEELFNKATIMKELESALSKAKSLNVKEGDKVKEEQEELQPIPKPVGDFILANGTGRYYAD